MPVGACGDRPRETLKNQAFAGPVPVKIQAPQLFCIILPRQKILPSGELRLNLFLLGFCHLARCRSALYGNICSHRLSPIQRSDCPPSTGMMQPVVAFASRRKTTARATSSGSGLPSGISPAFSLTPSGASTGPGATAFTRIVSAKSAAATRLAPAKHTAVENVHDGAPPGLPPSHQCRELARRIKIHRLKRCIVADEKRRVVDKRVWRVAAQHPQTRRVKLCRAKRLSKVGYDVCA